MAAEMAPSKMVVDAVLGATVFGADVAFEEAHGCRCGPLVSLDCDMSGDAREGQTYAM